MIAYAAPEDIHGQGQGGLEVVLFRIKALLAFFP